MNKEIIATIRSGIFAGICIGIAGFVYLAEKSIVGAVLFAFGLLTVIGYKLKLYTGTAGFVKKDEVGTLLLILISNIVGCFVVAMIARCSPMPVQETALGILEARLSIGALCGGVLAVGCGLIMTTAVNFARKGNNYPLLFGVPLFIMCGFPHCVADAFYYLTVPTSFWVENWGEILTFYLSIVIGNFVGCNLYRLVVGEKTDN
ncbi:MAG: formate/nitrite transporter family protein [Prevotellaceae bacterium]|nr:formate/nitrite transporter family protein [Prevotellaceae bacterium]